MLSPDMSPCQDFFNTQITVQKSPVCGDNSEASSEEMLLKEELSPGRASAANGRGPWWNAGASHMHAAFPKSYFDRRELLSLRDQRLRLQRTF